MKTLRSFFIVPAILFLSFCFLLTACPPPVPPAPAPDAPVAPTLTPGNAQIGVSWTAVSGAASYNVFYNTADNSSTATQFGGDHAGLSTTVTGLANGTTYWVWLKAKNAGGTSPFSSPTSATPVPAAPGAPAAPTLTPGNAQIGVSWTAVSGAASYNVFYNTAFNSGTATQFGGDVAGLSTTITGLTAHTRYYVWLKAKNAGGTSPFSLSACATPTGSAPANPLEALGGGNAADVSRFNGTNIYSIFAPQPASKPEANAAPSTQYSYTFAATGTAGVPAVTAQEIAYGSWTVGSLAAGQSRWYYFRASSGAVHNVYWDDSWSGSGTYTCDIKVSAYRENLSTAYFTNVDSGYSSPRTITASATENVFVKVQGYYSDSSGTFAIRDNPAGSPSFIPPPVVNRPPKKAPADVFTDGGASRPLIDAVYGTKQTDMDLRMRAAENQTLASKAVQLNKKASGIDAAAPSPIAVGTTWDDVYIATNGAVIDTTCQYVSTYAYFFVDNRDTAAMSSYLAGYGTAFDAIYGVNHSHFGSENDTDGNGKVIVVFSQELSGGLLGYFYAVDKFPKATYPESNEGDIFYITTTSAYQGAVVLGTLAHEFQHMIYFDEHYDRGVISTYSWLNEALSQAAEYYNGYTANHLNWIRSFLNGGWSGLSLTHWTSSNYGYGAVYIRYLIDRFGSTAVANMCATNLVGVAAVEAATGENFNTLFNDFSRALVMSGTGDSTDPKYNFTTLDLQAVQPSGRGGLTSTALYTTPTAVSGSFYAYRLVFWYWSGEFGTMTLSGTDIPGAAFGLSR